MGQKADEKWTAAAELQPTLPKPDRLLEPVAQGRPALDKPRTATTLISTEGAVSLRPRQRSPGQNAGAARPTA